MHHEWLMDQLLGSWWIEPFGTELRCASCEGGNYPNVSQEYQIPIYSAFGQTKIQTQFVAKASFPNLIEAINCTYNAIKASSQHEFVHVKEGFSFGQCTDQL